MDKKTSRNDSKQRQIIIKHIKHQRRIADQHNKQLQPINKHNDLQQRAISKQETKRISESLIIIGKQYKCVEKITEI